MAAPGPANHGIDCFWRRGLSEVREEKSWMPGTMPAMTKVV
jgi:hypothetical protein